MTDRYAGILIPLFSVRSANDLGRGEFAGLFPLGEFALAAGHRLIQLLPIDEVASGERSPYSALSVFALDPIYISADLLPGIDRQTGQAARAELVRGGRIDQVRLRALKIELLKQSYSYFQAAADSELRAQYEQFISEHRRWLDDYTIFRALKDRFGGTAWETWPQPLKNHEPGAVSAARRELCAELAMLKYVQFVAHWQWQTVRAHLEHLGIMLGGDLSFSPARESAEVWARQELFDLARSVGAPPDAFSPTGQRWGLPMPDWQRMRALDFEFTRSRVRHARALYDVLRVDHVVGLYRTYGYPLSAEIGGAFDPVSAAEQCAQGQEILRIMLEEAGPMRLFAEDLGVIPKFVRETLMSLGIPGYKVLRWEKMMSPHSLELSGAHDQHYINPAEYPVVALATTGTHDTETLVEWWTAIGADERGRLVEDLRIKGEVDCYATRLEHSTLDEILGAVYASRARWVITPIQDLFGWNARINFPGTISDTNWSWRLPFELERATDDPRISERIEQIRAISERSGRFRRAPS